jgi:prephenate dehydratase
MEQKKKQLRIAIQGGFGAFHDIAARHYFETSDNLEIVPRSTFKDVFVSLKNNKVDYGIMAIENSIAGSILPNYALLRESNMRISGEIYLRIMQNLVALPGQKIEDLKEVHSHPMAILQCLKFFDQYPQIRLVESEDTAISARNIAQNKVEGIGAISSKLAAERYGLDILAESIETDKMNYTRFLIVADADKIRYKPNQVNKATVTFALHHEIGGLSKILSILSFYNINLTKIQSMPIIGKDWEYQFYIDVLFDDFSRYRQALDAVKPFTTELRILGEYPTGNTVFE